MPRVLVPLAQGCEELEAVTIIDLLRRAGIEVITAGLDDQPVTASRGVRLLPDTSLDNVVNDNFDMIVLPGGLPGADNLAEDERIINLIQAQAASNKPVGAICAAPKVLAKAGVIEHKAITCYPGSVDPESAPSTKILRKPVVIDSNIITSRGPGTAMDFALTIIEKLLDHEAREQVEGPLVRPVN